MSEQPAPLTGEQQQVPLWVVELTVAATGKRHYLEVPTFQSGEAAARRALATAWALRIADVDEIHVTDYWLDDQPVALTEEIAR